MAGMMDQAPAASASTLSGRLDPILSRQEARPGMSMPTTPDVAASPLPIAFVTTRHRCPHCRKSYAKQGTAVKHMTRCFLSPLVRSCKTCRWFDFYPPEPEVGIMAPGYECRADVAVDLHVDRCSACGGVVYPAGTGECSCDPFGPIAKPVFGLRVRCPAWEAKP